MKRIALLFCLLIILLLVEKNDAQTIVCNDLIQISLDENCTYSMTSNDILEGINPGNCVVELDKILPYGDGPWVTPVLGPLDAGYTYLARVTHVPSGNQCWGNIDVEDKLPPILLCSAITIITVDTGSSVSITPADLNVISMDACGFSTLTFTTGPGTIQYDCADQGVHVVSLKATDEPGNTSTCQHTIVITNPTYCEPCMSACPPPVTVSFEAGFDSLLPAFQLQDWTAFEDFGDPTFDVACAAVDSFYQVDYEVGTGGYNWFSRRWFWFTALGEFIQCTQPVLFPVTNVVTVQGNVYLDNNTNCTLDAGEPGMEQFLLLLTKFPSGVTQALFPDSNGDYLFPISFDAQDSSALLRLVLPNGIASGCPSALQIPNVSDITLYTFNIGLQTQGSCPLMQVDLGALSSRRCEVNDFSAQYCNVGLDTALNATVTIQLDSLLSLQSSTLSYTAGPDNTYTFEVGNIPPFRCGTFYFGALIDCAATLGQTLCSEATAFPNTPCDGGSPGVFVTASARCEGDSIRLALWNAGQQDMTEQLDYIVIEDFIMYDNSSFQLAAGDSITIKTPANGATWRIEAEQAPDFPVSGFVSAAIEGCGGLNTPGLINAFSLNDNAIYSDLECIEVVASYDPNDKTAVPSGIGTEHIIRANETIEYRIRFQNTGNATAHKVVLIDTLSALLDPLSLELGAASHPYRVFTFAGGILHFVFDPISLPDSNANEAASHGFVKFRIGQKPDLADGTVIENTAAIYFDQNDPVITNTAFHTIGYPFQLVATDAPVNPELQVLLSPNPFHDQTVLTLLGKTLEDGQLLLYDSQGRLVWSRQMIESRTVLQRGDLQAGVYFFQIMDKGVGVASGKIQAF